MWPALLTLQHVGSSPSKSHHRTEGESIVLTSPKAGGDKRHSSVSVRDGRHPERLFSLGRGSFLFCVFSALGHLLTLQTEHSFPQ